MLRGEDVRLREWYIAEKSNILPPGEGAQPEGGDLAARR